MAMSTETKLGFILTRPGSSFEPKELNTLASEVYAIRYLCDGGATENAHTVEITLRRVGNHLVVMHFSKFTDTVYEQIPTSISCPVHDSVLAKRQG